ncbi:helix-turn-helix domain-containing protein [Yoonia sp. R2-816]|uniref:helix-turn-helix domain-containing protein n=1 Tax=Yoonia sp. R2-816 TaxID=3342638 RepID=UPI003729C468
MSARQMRELIDEGDDDLAVPDDVVRRRRTELGLTQEELAHRAGVSMRYISLLETQKHQPTLDTINGLSEGLETTMTTLVSEIEDLLRES